MTGIDTLMVASVLKFDSMVSSFHLKLTISTATSHGQLSYLDCSYTLTSLRSAVLRSRTTHRCSSVGTCSN